MSETVQYELSLRDGLSPKIQEADSHVNKLERSMGHLGEKVANVAEAFGVSFAIFKGIEFAHEGIEQTEKLDQASAQLQNTMENMGTFSQAAFDKITESSKEFSEHVKYNQDDILSLQSQLRMVGNIGESEMQRLMSVSADLATKMNMSLEEAGNLLARGVNSPEMARRVGMQLKIDPGVMAHIQDLSKHGKDAAARMELLAAAESKVGGAAEAAFNADPLSRFNKTMYDIKLEVGGLATKFLEALAPALDWTANAFRNVAHWIKEHKDLLVAVGIGIAAYISWVSIMTVVTNASAIATAMLTAAQTALNFVVSISPFGWLAIAIGAVVTVVKYCYDHFAKFRAVLWATWGVIKEFGKIVGDVFMGVGKMMLGITHFNISEIKAGWGQAAGAIGDAAKRIGKAASDGYAAGMADFNKDEEDKKKSLIPAPPSKGFRPALAMEQPKEPKTKATGSKTVTINVHIQDLVKTFNVHTTNIKQGAIDIKNMVANALADATNDFQVISDH